MAVLPASELLARQPAGFACEKSGVRYARVTQGGIARAAAQLEIGREFMRKSGASCWNRTSDPHRVKVVFYR